MIFVQILMLFGIAVILAIFEIQIEGRYGWAEKLPCWRAKPDSLSQRIYAAFMGGKSLDGFHLSELVLLLLFFHLPFGWGLGWTAAEELRMLAYFFTVAVCWDFLWFIYNPAYGWKNFKPENIWWHKKWWWKFPADYHSGLFIAVVLAGGSGVLDDSWTHFYVLGGVTSLTVITAVGTR